MNGGGQIGGQGSLPKRIAWVFVACCITVAVWNSFPHTPRGFYGELQHKSEQMRSVSGKVADYLHLDRFSEPGGQRGRRDRDGARERGDRGKPGSPAERDKPGRDIIGGGQGRPGSSGGR